MKCDLIHHSNHSHQSPHGINAKSLLRTGVCSKCWCARIVIGHYGYKSSFGANKDCHELRSQNESIWFLINYLFCGNQFVFGSSLNPTPLVSKILFGQPKCIFLVPNMGTFVFSVYYTIHHLLQTEIDMSLIFVQGNAAYESSWVTFSVDAEPMGGGHLHQLIKATVNVNSFWMRQNLLASTQWVRVVPMSVSGL